MVKRRISILGSTGSIGCNTVEVVSSLGGADVYDVQALTAGSNAGLLARQAKQLGANIAVIADESAYRDLKDALSGSGIEAAAGDAAVLEAAGRAADWTLSAIAGAAGLRPTLAAIRAGATMALANKESLVCAGPLMLAEARKAGVRILPVDSEHNAIFQVLDTSQSKAVERIILTASGGPFRDWPLERMRSITLEQALQHPNWSMGAGITIDSATMFNKGLEFIEAAQLFDVEPARIEVLIHPQSVIHSMVGYSDGSILAQLGAPDMRTPIAYALGWPDRVETDVERLDFAALARLDFEAPDETRFPALRIAREALEAGGLAPCAMNAAKEAAVTAFTEKRIGFLEVAAIVEDVLANLDCTGDAGNLNAILTADSDARNAAAEAIQARSRIPA